MVTGKTKDTLFKVGFTAWYLACMMVGLWVLSHPDGVKVWVGFFVMKLFTEAAVRVWEKS